MSPWFNYLTYKNQQFFYTAFVSVLSPLSRQVFYHSADTLNITDTSELSVYYKRQIVAFLQADL